MDTEEIADKIGVDVLNDIMKGKGESEILKKYGISEYQFSQIKRIILQQVKNKIDSTETTSHAVRYFKTLVKERSFATKAQEFGLTEPQQKLLYNVARGDFRATYGIIFALRNIISPSQWIYLENEELPKPVKFNPLVEKKYPHYDFDSRNELAKESTLGNIFFDVLKEQRAMSKFCVIHNCEKLEAANFVYMKHHKNGEMRYLARPSLPFIKKFREDVHPDWWFIYPDEVSKEYLQEIRNRANDCAASIRHY
ncbi:hypothetical protein [uncultured Treponema sp.]|uniref:hypothetical protein n=1 Tax=uncultured Treponema sp. TaxID=162155 RepID=UPI00259A4D46|nr:hypothetical protein [uncultured Treponema sp.]